MTVATLCAALGVMAMSAGCGGVSPSVEDRLPALTNYQGIAVANPRAVAAGPDSARARAVRVTTTG